MLSCIVQVSWSLVSHMVFLCIKILIIDKSSASSSRLVCSHASSYSTVSCVLVGSISLAGVAYIIIIVSYL